MGKLSMDTSLVMLEGHIYYKRHVSLSLVVHMHKWSNVTYLGPTKFRKLGPSDKTEYWFGKTSGFGKNQKNRKNP